MEDIADHSIPMDDTAENSAVDKVDDEFDSSDDEVDKAAALVEARAAVAKNPHSYEAHANLVNVLRTEDLAELRNARRDFSERFPLPAPVWLEWLEDESRFCCTPNEWDANVTSLIPRALSDYASVETSVVCIHLQGRRLGRGEMELKAFLGWFDVCFVQGTEKSPALSIAAYIYANGILVWKAYRKVLKDSNAPVEDQVQALSWQLAIPLRGNAEERRGDFFDAALRRSPDLHQQMKANEDDCLMLERFEKRLVDAGSDPKSFSGQREGALLSEYAAYAASEESRSCLSANVVWERCVTESFLCPKVWLQYGDFVQRSSALDSFQAYKPYVRAVKNVPWCLPVWIKYVQAATKLDKEDAHAIMCSVVAEVEPHVMQSEDVESAEQLSTLLVAVCREESLQRLLPIVISFNVKGTRSWANVLTLSASLCESANAAAEAMEQVISAFSCEALWWIRYAQIVSDVTRARAIYKRAVIAINSVVQLDVLTQSWLMFEAQLCRPGDAHLLDAPHFVAAQCALADRKETLLNSNLIGPRWNQNQSASSRKRPPSQLTRPRRKKQAPVKEPKVKDSKVQFPPGPAASSGGSKTAEKAKVEATYEPRVIYVNNLDFSVTPEQLEKVFSPAGKVSEVRMPRRRDGAAKGMAYIEFDDDDAAGAALSFHKMKISGREAWVRRSKPPKPKPTSHQKLGAAPTKLTGQSTIANRSDHETADTDSPTSKTKARKLKQTLRPRVILTSMADSAAKADASASQDKMEDDADQADNAPLEQDDFRAFVLGKKPGNAAD